MKKLLSIIVVCFFFIESSFAETISQRLDKIEKRLENIENDLDGTNFLKNILGNNEKLEEDRIPAETQIGFKLNFLSCKNDSLYDEIFIRYEITNNYKQQVKLVDAYFIAKDLFGDLVFKGTIRRDFYLDPGLTKTREGSYDSMFGNSCTKVKMARLSDLTVELYVSKIAFGDNTIKEFSKNTNSKTLDQSSFEEKELFNPNNIANLLELSKKEIGEKNSNTHSSSLTLAEEEDIKSQIFGCWSIPMGLPYSEDLVVNIKVDFRLDGSVEKTEILNKENINQENKAYFKVLADSALRAIKLCEPFRVPNNGYERWKEIVLNFDARALLGG